MNPPLTYRLKSTSPNIGGYRYFFNGQEGDNEVFGEVANFGYEFRQYDSRLGRWWSVDPKWNEYPSVSPYAFCMDNPIILKDPNGEYGVIVIHQKCDENGNIIGGTATLVMKYYYNSSDAYEGTDGKVSKENALNVEKNIKDNLDKLVGQPINIEGVVYTFSYNIQFVDLATNEFQNPDPKRRNAFYKDSQIKIGNLVQDKTLEKEGDVGWGSQYGIYIDFEKSKKFISSGRSDGQTATHELLHNIGAKDTGKSGVGIMDKNNQINQETVPTRILKMEDIENLFYPENERLGVIYED